MSNVKISGTVKFLLLTIAILVEIGIIFWVIQLPDEIKTGFFILPFILFIAYFLLKNRMQRAYTFQYLFFFLILLTVIGLVLTSFPSISRLLRISHPDSSTYVRMGASIGESFRSLKLPEVRELRGLGLGQISTNAYIIFIGLISAVIGKSYFGFQVISAFFCAFSIYNISQTFRVLYGRELPRIALLISFFYPFFYWMGIFPLRDSISLFFITALVLLVAKWVINGNLNLLSLSMVIVGVGLTRVENIGIVLIVTLVIFLLRSIPKLLKTKRISIFFTVVLILGIAFFLFQFWLARVGVVNLTSIESATAGRAEVGYANKVREFDSISELILGSVFAGAQFLTMPQPWTFAFGYTKAYIDGLYVAFILVLALFGLPKVWHEHRSFTATLLIFIIISSYAYGLIDVGAGVAARHRGQFLPLFLIFVGRLFIRRTQGRKKLKDIN